MNIIHMESCSIFSMLWFSTCLHHCIWSEFLANNIWLGHVLLIHSTNLCFLIGVFGPFTFNINIDTWGLLNLILYFLFSDHSVFVSLFFFSCLPEGYLDIFFFWILSSFINSIRLLFLVDLFFFSGSTVITYIHNLPESISVIILPVLV